MAAFTSRRTIRKLCDPIVVARAVHSRLRLPIMIARAVCSTLYALPSRVYLRLFLATWSRATHFRPLLSIEPRQLTIWQRVVRTALELFLAMQDRRYRRKLGAVGERPLAARSAFTERCPREGILLMIGSLGPGGAERQFVATLKGLRERGESNVASAYVHLSTPTQRFFLPDLEDAGIPKIVIGSEPETLIVPEVQSIIEKLPLELHGIKGYAATMSARRPTIVHLWLDEVNVKGGIAAVLTGVPRIILSQRSLPPTNFAFHQPYMREGYRWLAAAPGVVMINNSEAGARAYEKWLRLPRGTISVVRNGYSFNERELMTIRAARGRHRERIGIPADAPVVGTVIRLTEEKRPFLWLDIAARVRRAMPEARFLIVGDGPLRAVLEDRVNRLDLAGAVNFTGQVNDVLAAMVDMDVLLLTSRAEGLPNVLVEAQFVGVPVVATPVGGAPEVVNHSKSGWLLENDEPESCARRVVQILQDVAWRDRASRHGPAFAFARFGMQRAIDEILAVYGETATAAKGVAHASS
jgi:glycosyltransferase involved in cell wall biosynthesis